ncbi:MAG TPA: hypothetical protein DEP87_00230, partial [Candidatus Pacebacteria bacterium]|nr:hypothetical protein [Candidatus Paceibacterota bacterium]
MGSELFASLSIEKDEVIHGLTAHPLYGGLFCELTQRMIWAIGLKKGWEVDGDGKIAKADTSTNPKVRYNKRYDYGSNICASGGKVELKSLIEETFNTLIAEEREILMNSRAFEANPANRARLEETHNKRIDDLIARKDYISELAYHMYLGGNLLDKSLALRQRIGEQTKSHDSKTAKNFSVANDPFPDLDHKVNRYEKGFELSTALFLIFYPELKPQDLLDMGIISDTGDTEADNRARAKIAKMKIWRKLIIQYFNITGASLKGVTLENNKPMEFPRPGNSQDLEFLSAYCPTGQTSVAVEPIRAPEWGEEVFPSVYTVLTDPIYRDHQNWDQYYKAETSWIKFMDTIAAPVPADVTIDKIMGTNNDGLLTTIVESPILGMAKLVKGKHFDYVPPMLTFYIQELISNLHPNTKDSKARALKRIVQKLDNVSMRGLSAMYPQIQKVISNLIGDARFDRMVEG